MRILICGINFAPELTGIGKYTGEMAYWLANRGHDVIVITAPPYYPMWKVAEGYSRFSYAKESHDNLRIWRAPIWVPRQPRGVTRLLHLATFAISSLPLLVKGIFWKPDAIWLVEPPLACAPGILIAAKLAGSKSWLHVQDYEVDAAFGLGLLKGGWLKNSIKKIESFVMKKFSMVSSISVRMCELAEKKGVEPSRLVLFPNWVDLSNIFPINRVSDFRGELGIREDEFVALYSGNMGGKQGLDVLAKVAAIAKEYKDIRFVFCGNGSGKAELVEECRSLSNVLFIDLQPIDRLNQLLGLADVHLLPQREDAADLVMPSKLTGMFASGKAVVAMSKKDTELWRVVNARGIIVEPNNAVALADAIFDLYRFPEKRHALGMAGREYALKELGKEAVLSRFESNLIGLCNPH